MLVKVVVTGGGGYLGTSLVPLLLQCGHEVTVVDRFFFGKSSLEALQTANPLRLIRDDTRWFDGRLLIGQDAVVDMAALSNDPAGELDPWKTYDINYLGRTRVARLARQAGVARYILTSSCSVYGFRDGLVDESTAVNPLTAYARANVLAEQDTLPIGTEDFCPVAIRMATLYGLSGRMRFDLAINAMVLSARSTCTIPVMRDGTQWRPFLHVRDAARAIEAILHQDPARIRGQVFNIGSDDQNYQIRPLAELIAKNMSAPPRLEWYGDSDKRSYRVSFRRAREELSFVSLLTPADATQEVESALSAGTLIPSPENKTVEWYRHLLEDATASAAVALRGTVL